MAAGNVSTLEFVIFQSLVAKENSFGCYKEIKNWQELQKVQT
jgi:hypothetical protein